jgi:uncharacterized membrane protein YadS
MATVNRKWYDGMASTEDWWAVWLGLIMFAAGLMSIWGLDLVGWMTKTKTWELSAFMADPSWGKLVGGAHTKAGQAYEGMGPFTSLLVTWAVFCALTCMGAYFQKLDVKKFFAGFTIIFFITWASWIIGHEAHFKALKTGQSITQSEIYGADVYCTTKVNKCTKQINKELEKLGVDIKGGQVPDAATAAQAVDGSKNAIRMAWGLQLGGGFSYMLALAVGLIIGNFMKGFAGFLKEAAKPEWFIKTAIVYLGIKLGLMSMKATGYALELALAGAAATFVAYLMFWPIVYALGRKVFKLRRDASAVLSSGISICGVSAAIATAGAIRAKPILPVAVSMLIVIFAMLELVVLPAFYSSVAPDQPIVNGAAMGMTVKTDGADAAAGAILDEMMVANNYRETGIQWEADWILSAAVLTKIWIDVFIGVWAFVLAMIWVYKVEKTPGQSKVGASEIWFRFPKFVLGYFIAWFFYVGIAALFPEGIKAASSGASIVQSPMRKMMFMLTFVSIGVITDFSKLKGMGKLAVLYAIALFVIIAPIAYIVAYVFHHGMVPPLVGAGG